MMFSLLFASDRGDPDTRPPRAGTTRQPAVPSRVPSHEPDRTLVQRVREGDVIAFEMIYREHYAMLCTLAHRYVHAPDIAEELVQEVLSTVWTRRAEWSVSESIRAYVLGAVRHAALNHLRRARVELRWEHTVEAGAAELARTDASVGSERTEIATLVHGALAELSEGRRTVVTLRWLDGLSYAEIASVLGTSAKAVEVQLYRTLRALRAQLGSRIGE
jgi:RNA polymerase sigma-70 factor (ECF subfamily)